MNNENKKTLKGSVLFTTVSVMALLIIFLMGTLTLAQASNNRAHRAYSTSQASYTARAAVDSFVTAMKDIYDDGNVAIAVEQLGADGRSNVIYPELHFSSENGGVFSDDRSIGEIGCYDGDTWLPNTIRVENTGEKKLILNADSVLEEHDVVKITAVARVGKQEETVCAYINKLPEKTTRTKMISPTVRGLQVTGGATFPTGKNLTGGLGINLREQEIKPVSFKNQTEIDTSLSFINGNLTVDTTSFKVKIGVPTVPYKKITYPLSETVITGNLRVNNNSVVELYDVDNAHLGGTPYEYMANWTEQEKPYLYVDGLLDTHSGTPLISYKDSTPLPFNFFAGTTVNGDGSHTVFGRSNVYLLDEASNEYFNGDAFQKTIQKGHNVIGSSANGAALYGWADSVVNKTVVNNQPIGNIFCNGDLTLQQATIDGDVRVKGNCTILDGVTISGRLIVGGTLTYSDDKDEVIGGIFNGDKAVGGTEKVPYQKVDNEVYNKGAFEQVIINDRFKVPYLVWNSEKMTNIDNYEVDLFGNVLPPEVEGKTLYYRWVDDYDCLTNAMSIDAVNKEILANETSDPPYEKMIEAPLYQEMIQHIKPEYELAEDIDDDFYYGYPMNISDDGQMTEFVPSGKRIDDNTREYYYNKADGYFLPADDYNNSKLYYVTRPDGSIVDDHEPVKSDVTYWYDGENKDQNYAVTIDEVPLDGTIKPLSASGFEISTIYPSNMTREKIYGEMIDGAFAQPSEDTKIVTNIGDARESLGLDRDTGDYTDKIYDENSLKAKEVIARKVMYDGSMKDANGQPIKVPANVTSSCYIKDYNLNGNNNGDLGTITVDSNEANVVIVFDNVKSGNNFKLIFNRHEDLKQELEIIFKNDVEFNNSAQIVPAKSTSSGFAEMDYANTTIHYADDWHITYYSLPENGKTVNVKVTNPSIFFGSFKCPYAKFDLNVKGPYTMKYEGENGKILPAVSPSIVGNALFKEVVTSNEFDMIYTESGHGGAPSVDPPVIKTKAGRYEVSYYAAS